MARNTPWITALYSGKYGECIFLFFSKQKKTFLFEFSFCIGLHLFINLFIREFIGSLFPVQGVCADFSATTTHSLCFIHAAVRRKSCAILLSHCLQGTP